MHEVDETDNRMRARVEHVLRQMSIKQLFLHGEEQAIRELVKEDQPTLLKLKLYLYKLANQLNPEAVW